MTASSPVTPAAAAQLRLLEEIHASGNGSRKLREAVEKLDDSASSTNSTSSVLLALRSLPVTGYEPEFAEACSRAVDALRSIRDGGESSVEENKGKYVAALSDIFADAARVEVRGFGLTSGTSGAARKIFPQTAEAVRRRNAFFALKPPLVASDEARLNLFVPARPEVLCHASSLSTSDGNGGGDSGDGRDRTTQGPVTAILFDPWIRRLESLLGEEGADPSTDVDPVRGDERLSYPLAVAVAEGVDVEQRLYLMWLCTLARGGERVRLVSDTFGGSTMNAVRVLRSFGEEIARDLRAGKLSDDFFGAEGEEDEATRDRRERLRRAVDLYIAEPRPREAQQLEEALASEGSGEGEGLLAKLLPNVRFVSAIFTGSMSKYLGPTRSLLRSSSSSPPTVITEFYGGSEGTYGVNEALLSRSECFGAPREDESTPGLELPEPQRFVAMTGVDAFLEFLPLDDGGESSPKQPLSVVDGGVPVGKDYELVVTNFMGLCRYRVGDVVRVVGAFEPPATAGAGGGVEEMRGAPVFEFVGRAGSALNLVWEKYDEGALLAAVADAAASLAPSSPSAPWKDFAAREDVGRGGEKDRYVLYLEPASSSSNERDFVSWADALERALRSRNEVYRILTTKGQIAPVRACVVSSGSFDALRDAAVASGTAHAQYKAPVVVEADAENGKRAKILEARVLSRVDASRLE